MAELGDANIDTNWLFVIDYTVLFMQHFACHNCIPFSILSADCNLSDVDWFTMQHYLDSTNLR